MPRLNLLSCVSAHLCFHGLPLQTVGLVSLSVSGCDCRYSTALEATGISHTPHCMPIDATELQDFCVDSGYNVRLERSGTFFTPPSFNVHLTDWERAARLRYFPGILGLGLTSSCMHGKGEHMHSPRRRVFIGSSTKLLNQSPSDWMSTVHARPAKAECTQHLHRPVRVDSVQAVLSLHVALQGWTLQRAGARSSHGSCPGRRGLPVPHIHHGL